MILITILLVVSNYLVGFTYANTWTQQRNVASTVCSLSGNITCSIAATGQRCETYTIRPNEKCGLDLQVIYTFTYCNLNNFAVLLNSTTVIKSAFYTYPYTPNLPASSCVIQNNNGVINTCNNGTSFASMSLTGYMPMPSFNIWCYYYKFQRVQVRLPTRAPSRKTTWRQRSKAPSKKPYRAPSAKPVFRSSRRPSRKRPSRPNVPSAKPVLRSTRNPSRKRSSRPQPYVSPSFKPSASRSRRPSIWKTFKPTAKTSSRSSFRRTSQPTAKQTLRTSIRLNAIPTSKPMRKTTSRPTAKPISKPTTKPSASPSEKPSLKSSLVPSSRPNARPTTKPSLSKPSLKPNVRLTIRPTAKPTMEASKENIKISSKKPSSKPSQRRTTVPTVSIPTLRPSNRPLTRIPTSIPSKVRIPTATPSKQSLPTLTPSRIPTKKPSKTMSSKPTTLICNRLPSTRAQQITQTISSISDSNALSNTTSPQALALDWILNQDGLRLCPEASQLIQRYSLAVFYFSTNGDSWVACGRRSTVSCNPSLSFVPGDPIIARYSNRTWLSRIDECLWGGLSCNNSTGQVDRVEFNSIMSNKVGGTLPMEITQFSAMRFLIIDNCCSPSIPVYGVPGFVSVSGRIPSNIGVLSSLLVLDVGSNTMSGTIPSSLMSLTKLRSMVFASNKFGGTFPSPAAFGVQFQKLLFLHIEDNMFSGNIPNFGWSVKLTNLTMQGNKGFSGSIPSALCSLTGASNNFTLKSLWADCTICSTTVPCCTRCF